jgi:type I restriction enzyme S subunit
MQTIEFDSTDHKRYWISEYQKIEVSVPNPDEQIRIAQILSDMDSEIEALEQKLKKQKQIKQGMMQVLLTGKVRLV